MAKKQNGKIQIKMCDDNGNPFIATLHNVILAPDLCDRLFSTVTLMNSGHTCSKGITRCTSAIIRKMRLLWHILHRGNIHFWSKQSIYPSQREYHLERDLLCNYYTIDWDTDIPDH